MSLYQGDERDYDTSFGEGVWQGIKTSFFLSFVLSLFGPLMQSNSSLAKLIETTFISFFSISLITSFITLIVILIVASPTVVILRYFDLNSDINGALVAGALVFAFLMWVSSGNFESSDYIIVFWGMACGYAFMRGYHKGEKQ